MLGESLGDCRVGVRGLAEQPPGESERYPRALLGCRARLEQIAEHGQEELGLFRSPSRE
jgi:hypothetical protein